MLGEREAMTAEDLLAFAGITPPTIRVYPVETHLAEKVHAYTVPRARPSSRVKDLPDMALLATVRPLRAAQIRAALTQTFEHRETHAVPAALPSPPETWAAPYAAMARQDSLPWASLDEVTAAVRAFLDPALDGVEATWDPASWRWVPA